jgi:hypothetical protein
MDGVFGTHNADAIAFVRCIEVKMEGDSLPVAEFYAGATATVDRRKVCDIDTVLC